MVDVGADSGENASKRVWSFPSRSESCYPATAVTSDCSVVGILRDFDWSPVLGCFLFYFGQELFDEETSIIVAQAVVFVSAVKAVEGSGLIERQDASMAYEDSDGYGHVAFVNQIVEHGRRLVHDFILADVEASGFRSVVLMRDIHPVFAKRAREN